MQTEVEAKWLNIDLDSMRKELENIGARLVQPERLMIRRIYDYPNGELDKKGGWVRVRHEGDKCTLSYKQLNNRTLHGTKEVAVVVDDFDATCSFLESIGLVSRSYQETKRESWLFNGTEIELDTWPWIPSFVEIEAADEVMLKDTADKLGLSYSEALHGSVEVAYQVVYDVTEKEITTCSDIRFMDVPDWLIAKKKSK